MMYTALERPEPYDLPMVRAEILGRFPAAFDRYENPFETKWTLRDKFNLPPFTAAAMERLEATIGEAAGLFRVALEADRLRHYHGVFIYESGDQLSAHLDAGIHPATGKRKHVTALLYLGGGGDLEMWRGDAGAPAGPAERLAPDMGRLVLFENNDRAWHSAAPNDWPDPRIVLTVSFMSDVVNLFKNKRERAYFVPRPGEVWTPEMYELRDKRADPEKYAEVYREGNVR